ncbi:hypothetical protein AXG93_2931s1220 [Marchantia polymorpha subsp. ruderalis]|uniref:Uncharacterized protein n=1 Tax=Marchantia polymorpha subsp. ruderalis TaxID=1480154 RepID=A0A176VVQ5_MARPO|nr:hypothetical protein AXG93_2931s1220 [Marchantia polymorpha subsp. ruderalis]
MDGWRRNLQSSETRRGERSRLAWTGLDSTLVRQRFGSSRALAQLESSVVGRPLRGRRRIARRLGRVVFRSRVRVVDGLSRRDRQKRFAQPDDGVDQAENRQEYHPYGVLENHQNVSMLASSPAVGPRASPPMDPVGATRALPIDFYPGSFKNPNEWRLQESSGSETGYSCGQTASETCGPRCCQAFTAFELNAVDVNFDLHDCEEKNTGEKVEVQVKGIREV